MLRQLLIANVFHFLHAAEAAGGEVLEAAHLLDAAHHGVAALLVDAGAQRVEHFFPLAVHVFGQQQSAAGGGVEQQLAQQLAGGTQHVLLPGQEGALRDAGVKADALDLADAAHDRLDRRAVQLVEARGDGVHVLIAGAAAAQHIGQQRVHRRGLPRQLGQQVHAQAGGFEFVGTQGVQPYARHQFRAVHFHGGHLPILF